jgi:hypothetical protein
VEAIKRHTTCNCNACRLIPTLDLKFIVHFGEYVLQGIGGAETPIGSAVNLVHRLSKNGVTEATGWRAYVLLTEPAVTQLSLDAAAMQRGVEHYEHLGEVVTFSADLAERTHEDPGVRAGYHEAHDGPDYALPQPHFRRLSSPGAACHRLSISAPCGTRAKPAHWVK